MASPLPRKRRSASRIFIALILLAAAGTGAYFKFFHRSGDSSDPRGTVPPPLARFETKGPLMGIEVAIVAYAPDETSAKSAFSAAFARGTAIGTTCSEQLPSSDLSRLNAATPGSPVSLSPTFTTLLAHALDTAEVTDGTYDPTLGALSTLWQQSRTSGLLPNPASLDTAREASGWKHLEFDLENNTATLGKQGMSVELGGIATGYAIDEMLHILEQHGITRAMVRAEKEVRIGAPPPGEGGWQIDLRMLDDSMRESIVVSNCAVATAGGLDHFTDIGGTRYAHIVDPATGLGLTRRVTATIIAPTAIQSAPLATFSCISPDTAVQVFIGGEIRCRTITINGLDLQDRRSPNFPSVQAF